VNDTMPDRDERPLKYKWTEHAERNSIYNAARTGTSLVGSTIYISLFPCTDCARAIAQSGIAQLVTTCPPNDKNFMDRWGADFRISSDILTESSVRVSYVEKRTLV
ncbi:MAG: deaminase, partial [Candidatus Saccharimonadales bacterium]